jgi:hypothetical protein
MANSLISYFLENEEDLLRYSSLAMITFSIIAFLLEMAGINVFDHSDSIL